MYYINVYEMSQAYGGPEEGGWYYVVGEPVTCIGKFSSREEADKTLKNRTLYGKMGMASDEYQMGYGKWDGCDPDGNGDDVFLMRGGKWGRGEVTIYIEEHPAKSFPEEIPYYC